MNNPRYSRLTKAILATTVAVTLGQVANAAADVDIDDDGLIEISTLQQLDLMRYDLAGTSLNGDSTGCPATGCNGYELVNDLDFDTNGNGVADAGDEFWNNGEGWVPVGSSANNFESKLYGNGYKILNLYINRLYSDNIGLFGVVKNSTLDSIILENISVLGDEYVAAVVGIANSSDITSCEVSGSITSRNSVVGGVAGWLLNSSLDGCAVNGSVQSLGENSYWALAGGIAGDGFNSTIDTSEFHGDVSATNGSSRYVGGLIGLMTQNVTLTNSYASGTVSGYLGIGGAVGYVMSTGSSMAHVYSLASVSGINQSLTGGLVGYANNTPAITTSYWDTDISGQNSSDGGTAKTTSELQCPTAPGDVSCDPTIFADWDATVWDFGTSAEYPVLIRDSDNDGYSNDVDVDDDNNGLIEISTLQQLDLMRYDLAGTSLNGDSTGCPATGCNGYELVNDLDFDTNGNGIADAGDEFWNNGAGWEPVGSSANNFESKLYGNGYKILNLYINRLYSDNIGLFGVVKNSTLDSIILENISVLGDEYVAAVVGIANSSDITSCEVSGSITSRNSVVGGVAGWLLNSSLDGCAVNGSVQSLGENSYWALAGGIAGDGFNSTIDTSEFHGDVSATNGSSRYVGGLIGLMTQNVTLTNSYASGTVSGYLGIGGAVGYVMSTGSSMAHVYSLASVSGINQSLTGGLVGYANNTPAITTSYWDTDISGQNSSDGGTAKTTSELQCPTAPGDVSCDPTIFADWDATVWDFGTSTDYPVLR